MLKKIIICLSVLLLSFTVIFQPKHNAEAAVVGKVVSLAAKQAVKEAIEKSAVQTVGSLALKEVSSDIAKNYTKKEGFKLVVIEGTKNNPKKVAQVIDITKITSTQKKQLNNRISELLEQKIYGSELATWQKWLDVIVPIWSAAAVGTVVGLMLTGDMQNMINDISFQALTDLGFIGASQTITTGNIKTPIGFSDTSSGKVTSLDGDIIADGFQSVLPPDFAYQEIYSWGDTASGTGTNVVLLKTNPPETILANNAIIIWDFMQNWENELSAWTNNDFTTSGNFEFTVLGTDSKQRIYNYANGSGSWSMLSHIPFSAMYYYKNGELVRSYSKVEWSGSAKMHELLPISKAKRIIMEPVRIIDDMFVNTITLITYSGDVYQQITKGALSTVTAWNFPITEVKIRMPESLDSSIYEPKYRVTVASNKEMIEIKPYTPVQNDVSFLTPDELVVKSPGDLNVLDDKGVILTPTIQPNGDIIYTNPYGETIPEEKLDLSPQQSISILPNGQPVPDIYGDPLTGSPSPPDSGDTGKPSEGASIPNAPNLLVAFGEFLLACIMYVVRLATFIMTIPKIEAKEFGGVVGETVTYFKNIQYGNIKPYTILLTLVNLLFGFLVYKILRRVFNG